MDSALIQRYQIGGDIYESLKKEYGQANADGIAQAALSGDEIQINAALTQAKFGDPLDTSTADAFGNLIATDPLGAPIASLNNQLSKIFGHLFTSPAVLVTVVLIVLVLFFGSKKIKVIPV